MGAEHELRLAVFIGRFRELTERRRNAKTETMAAFLDGFRQQLTSATHKRRFNVFDLTGVGGDEVRHSSILAWLLAPHGSHGGGPHFLEAFLRAAEVDGLLPEELVGSHVQTEFAGHESIIDILVYKPSSFVLYVENKIFAAEGFGQIDREFRDMERFGKVVRVPRERMFPVFLTPSGYPPTSGDPGPWHRASYVRLASEFERLRPRVE